MNSQLKIFGESLIEIHPIIDGNKRTGLLAMVTLLKEFSIEINAGNDNLYQFVISISTGEIKFDEIVQWLKTKMHKL